MQESQIKAQFESWIKSEKGSLKDPLKLNSRGNYAVRATQLRYEGFLAAMGLKK